MRPRAAPQKAMQRKRNGNGKALPVCERTKCRKRVKRRGRRYCSPPCARLAQNGKADAPDLKAKLEGAYRAGGTDATAAAVVGLSRGGLAKLMAREPDLAEKVEMWKAVADGAVVSATYKAAIDGNVTAQIWWTKNRIGWRDRGELNVVGASLAELLAAAEKE